MFKWLSIGNREGQLVFLNGTRVTIFINFHREKCQKRHQKLFYNVLYIYTKYIQVSSGHHL